MGHLSRLGVEMGERNDQISLLIRLRKDYFEAAIWMLQCTVCQAYPHHYIHLVLSGGR